MRKAKYQPRYTTLLTPHPLQLRSFVYSNYVPWAIIAAAIGACAILILGLRYMLYFENKRRDGEQRDETYDDVYLTQETKDGIQFDKRIDKVGITVITVLFKRNLTNYTITRLSSTSPIFRTVISVTRYKF